MSNLLWGSGMVEGWQIQFSQPWSVHLCRRSCCRLRARLYIEFVRSPWLSSVWPETEDASSSTASCIPSAGWEGHPFRKDSGLLHHTHGGAEVPPPSHTWGTLNQWASAEVSVHTMPGLGLGSSSGSDLIYRIDESAGSSKAPVIYIWISHVTDYNYTICWPGQKSWFKKSLPSAAHSHPHVIGCCPLRCVNTTFSICIFLQKVTANQITRKSVLKTILQ